MQYLFFALLWIVYETPDFQAADRSPFHVLPPLFFFSPVFVLCSSTVGSQPPFSLPVCYSGDPLQIYSHSVYCVYLALLTTVSYNPVLSEVHRGNLSNNFIHCLFLWRKKNMDKCKHKACCQELIQDVWMTTEKILARLSHMHNIIHKQSKNEFYQIICVPKPQTAKLL